jgi:hypothetical protein
MLTADSEELAKIARFLTVLAPFIQETVKRPLIASGFEVVASGEGFDLSYDIRHEDKRAVFYFRNMYLEIATVDRDAEPLKFDERLGDYRYFLSKTFEVIKSKLDILLKLLKSTDTDKTIDEIFAEFNGGRVLIEKVNKPGRKNGSNPNPANN